MTEFLPRSAWTRTGFSRKLVPFDGDDLKGVAVHYTGSSRPLGPTASLGLSASRILAERKDHVERRGWTDVAYNYAIDQMGRVFELRSEEYRSAANGDATQNKLYGAITFLIGAGDTPTPAALRAFQDWRTHVWLKRWPDATGVVGHRDLASTQCPGDALYHLLDFLDDWPKSRTSAEEPPMPTSIEIADELFSDAPDGARYKVRRPDGSLASIPVAMTELYALLTKIKEQIDGRG